MELQPPYDRRPDATDAQTPQVDQSNRANRRMKADSGSARPSRDRTVLINPTPVLDAIGANTTFGPTFSQEGPLQTRAYITTLVGLLVAACSHTTRTVIVEPSPELRSGARVESRRLIHEEQL